jgi:hypothetical protein
MIVFGIGLSLSGLGVVAVPKLPDFGFMGVNPSTAKRQSDVIV